MKEDEKVAYRFTSNRAHALMDKIMMLLQGGDIAECAEAGMLLGMRPASIKRYFDNLVAIGDIHITRFGKSYGHGKRPSENTRYAFGPAPEGFVPQNRPKTMPKNIKPRAPYDISSATGQPNIRLTKARNTGEFPRCEFETFFYGSAK